MQAAEMLRCVNPGIPRCSCMVTGFHSSFPQVVSWTGLVLDAHYTQLVLSPEAKEILVELHIQATDQVGYLTTISIYLATA